MRLPSGEICTSSAYSSWNTSIDWRRRTSPVTEEDVSAAEAATTNENAAPKAANERKFMGNPGEEVGRTLTDQTHRVTLSRSRRSGRKYAHSQARVCFGWSCCRHDHGARGPNLRGKRFARPRTLPDHLQQEHRAGRTRSPHQRPGGAAAHRVRGRLGTDRSRDRELRRAKRSA